MKSLSKLLHFRSRKCIWKWPFCLGNMLTHWGRVTHMCVDHLTSIASDNGLSPGRRQAIIWFNAGILLIGPLATNFSEIVIDVLKFLFKKKPLKVSSAKWRPFCLGLRVLSQILLGRTMKMRYALIASFHVINLMHFLASIYEYINTEFAFDPIIMFNLYLHIRLNSSE